MESRTESLFDSDLDDAENGKQAIESSSDE